MMGFLTRNFLSFFTVGSFFFAFTGGPGGLGCQSSARDTQEKKVFCIGICDKVIPRLKLKEKKDF